MIKLICDIENGLWKSNLGSIKGCLVGSFIGAKIQHTFCWMYKSMCTTSEVIMLAHVVQACCKWGELGTRAPPPPQFLANQLTLSQPGGTLSPPSITCPPPLDFQTLRRPCRIFCFYWKSFTVLGLNFRS